MTFLFSLTASGLGSAAGAGAGTGAGAGALGGGVGAFRMDMGVIEIVGTRFGAIAATKAFWMLLILWAERE